MIGSVISQAGAELGSVVKQVSDQLQSNITLLSNESHDERLVTKDGIILSIDYAAYKIGQTIDERISVATHEVSLLVTEKIAHVPW